MSRYIKESDVYKLVEPHGVAKVHCSQIDELPRVDVVDIVREIFEEIEQATKNHGITYTQRKIAELKKKYIP